MATAILTMEPNGATRPGREALHPVWGVEGRGNLIERALDPEHSLVAQCLSGDETAWEQLVRLHTRPVYALCYRFTGSSAEAQDLTQEVFVRVFRTLKSFRSAEGSFATWLARVTRNLLIDHYRRTKQERVTDSIEGQLPTLEQEGPATQPDRALAGREASEILQAALQKLSPDAVKESDLAGERITAKLTRAPGNQAPIGGLKVVAESGWFGLKKAKSVNVMVPGEPGAAIPIRGINTDLPVRFAPNGGAVPGDRIVGILTPGEGITIYPIQSSALKDFEDVPERWLDLRWDVEERTPQRFPARLVLQTVNEPGSLAQVAQVIAEHDGNIDNISMERSSPDFTSVTIDLEVFDLKHLNSIIAQLRAKDVVANAERVNA